jgi:hypothetical protein
LPRFVRAEADEFALRDYDAVLATDHGKAPYPLSNEDRAGILQKRAFSYVHLRRFDDAASDMISSVNIGGTAAILRMQVLLRRHGFSEVPVNGHESPALHKALVACFGINACFQGVMQPI